MNKEISLGKRLGAIKALITQSDQYAYIWDCCCDHGYLGACLLDHYGRNKKEEVQINFVDQVSHITSALRKKLSHNSFSNYQVFTLNVEQLIFDKRYQHCIILAGITTTGTLKILQAILDNHPAQNLDFILCPTRGQYDLRQFLIEQKAYLLNEVLLKENNRHYEILHVRINRTDIVTKKRPVTEIGEFWQNIDEDHLSYLQNRVQHYQQKALGKKNAIDMKALGSYSEKLRQVS